MRHPFEYRAWLCDLDGTLYRPTGLKLVMGLELALFGRSDIRTIRAFREQHERLRAETAAGALSTRPPFEEQLARTASELGIDETSVRQRVEHWMIERPSRWLARFRRDDLMHEISAFRGQGGKTAVVSDYPAKHKLRSLQLHELFDIVIANGESDGPEALKPEPSGYLKAAERLGVVPGECLVIGDRDDADGKAAQAAGMAFRRVG